MVYFTSLAPFLMNRFVCLPIITVQYINLSKCDSCLILQLI